MAKARRKRTSVPSTKSISQTLNNVYERSAPSPAGYGRLWLTSTGRQSVKSERNQEKQIAVRSTPRLARWACSFGRCSFTKSSNTRGQARDGRSDGAKKSSGRIRSIIAQRTQNASSSFANTSNRVDVTRFIPWQYPTEGFRLNVERLISLGFGPSDGNNLTDCMPSKPFLVSVHRGHHHRRTC